MKKIEINNLKVVPKSISKEFKLCAFITPEQKINNFVQDVKNWIDANNLEVEFSDNFINVNIPKNIEMSDLFFESKKFEWMDGFSPNLNKKLHIGHLSNLVLAKAFKSLGICKKTVSIYGDTLTGEVSKESALILLKKHLSEFNFHIDKEVFASEIKYNGNLLKPGTDEYDGTQIFEIDGEKTVGIKSGGQTSYFYQDVALAELLNSPTLYLTGSEQSTHFNMLKKMYPLIEHIGLGLVKVSGKKMASRTGNVIFVDEFIEQMNEQFNNNISLIYNLFAGFILKSNPEVNKGINLDIINNPKNSAGLYISYTTARLISAGCEIIHFNEFTSRDLEFACLKSRINLKPNVLFESLVEYCKEINSLYGTCIIRGSENNKKMFEEKLSNLVLGIKLLGLFVIEKV